MVQLHIQLGKEVRIGLSERSVSNPKSIDDPPDKKEGRQWKKRDEYNGGYLRLSQPRSVEQI